MTRLAFIDLECNALLRDATIVWCAVAITDTGNCLIYHVPTKEKIDYPLGAVVYSDINLWIEALQGYVLAAHAGIGFDFPVLRKLHNWQYKLDNVVDTHVLSRLLYPDRVGHSIGYYGELFKSLKGTFNQFDRFSNEMLQYCIQDVTILERTYHYLMKEAEGWDWSESIKLEKKIADIQMRQEMKGVLFDSKAAHILDLQIANELGELERVILRAIPCKAVQVGVTITKPYLKSGEYSKQVIEWIS